MPFFTYILYSTSKDSFYKGATNDLDDRIKRHNAGYEKATAPARPWIIIWAIEKPSKAAAMELETKLKNLSRSRTIQFIQKYPEGIRHKIATDLINNIPPGFEP